MPNGGSDCCGTCWFNARNKGEAGYEHQDDPEPDVCIIRNLPLFEAFWTYCANHPRHRPEPDPIPIGPVFVNENDGRGRLLWQPSPDTEIIRCHLLDLLREIPELPSEDYPLSLSTEERVVWQLGEFRETRAIPDLHRITAFVPDVKSGPYGRARQSLIAAAREALGKINEQ